MWSYILVVTGTISGKVAVIIDIGEWQSGLTCLKMKSKLDDNEYILPETSTCLDIKSATQYLYLKDLFAGFFFNFLIMNALSMIYENGK